MADDQSWAGRIARLVASNVRYWRRQRGMSAEDLSDAMTKAGAPITRQVLTNFETGRRPTVSVAELLAFAALLDVSPLVLVTPDPEALKGKGVPDWELSDPAGTTVEILRDRRVPTPAALAWLANPALKPEWEPLAGGATGEPRDSERVRRLLHHEVLVRALDKTYDEKIFDSWWSELVLVRALLRNDNQSLPTLPPDLAERERLTAFPDWMVSNSPRAQGKRLELGLPQFAEPVGEDD